MEATIKMKHREIDTMIAPALLSRSINKPGLCAYCKCNPICTLSNENGLIFDCSDYEDGDTFRAVAPLSALTYEFGMEETLRLKGLCRNCSRQDKCTLSTSPDGIWRCEEDCQ